MMKNQMMFQRYKPKKIGLDRRSDRLSKYRIPGEYQNIEFPAKAGIHVHSEIHGPRDRRRENSVVGTAVKAKKSI